MNTHLLQSRRFVITLGLLMTVAALTIDLSLPAIPAMVEALHTTLSHGQQIVGVFMVGMACGQIPAGLFSDRLGRLPTLYVGLTIFSLSAIAAAMANSIEIMLVARYAQGVGAASAVVLGRAIVRDVSSGRDAARLMSLMTMIFTAAPVIAPSIGSLLVAHWGWRAPFEVIAVAGIAVMGVTRLNLVETHVPRVNVNPVRQLASSFREFFSHRQSIFGLLLMVLPPAGFMSIIAVSAALAVDIYGFSIEAYGLIFACAGVSILLGSFANRILVLHFDQLQLIGLGVALILVSSTQLAIIALLDAAPFWWLWSSVCLFMFTVAILMSNSMVVALDPLPRIAGVASSIIGTVQNLMGASGSLLAASIYDGSVRNSVIIMAAIGLIATIIFVLRPWIAPGPLVHNPDELARD